MKLWNRFLSTSLDPKHSSLPGMACSQPLIQHRITSGHFRLANSDTHPFHLETTYGLRARSMRVFPNILLNNKPLTEETDHVNRPRITRYTPGHLRIQFSIIDDVSIQLDFHIPENNALVGGFDIVNRASQPISMTLELAASLLPMDIGSPMHPLKVGINHILEGQSGDLWPVLFMTGGPMAVSNPYPALSLPVQISPSESRRLTWSLVTKNDQSDSFESARRITAAPWRDQTQEHFMAHEKQTIHIRTGVADWDAALYLSQMNAMTHIKTTQPDNATQFIRMRLPDQARSEGFSKEIEDKITILELRHLSQVILPSHHKTLKSHIEFILNQLDESELQKPAPGDISALKSFRDCPLLTQICLEIYEIDQDKEFLQTHFPVLNKLFNSWIRHNEDADKRLPLTWDNPDQLGIDSGLFMFDKWAASGQGLNIRCADSPALTAMLLREAKALQKISGILANEPQRQTYNKIESLLQEKVQAFWQDDRLTWSYQDYQSHLSPKREIYYPGPAPESLEIHKTFTVPQRLLCHLYAGDDQTRVSHIIIYGVNSDGEEVSEDYPPSEVQWFAGTAHITTANLYRVLHAISLQGLNPNDRFLVETANFFQSDITCLAPVWAGAARNGQLEALLNKELNWQDINLEYGIPETWQCLQALPDELPIRVNVLWNSMIIKGLLEGGYPEPAMHLFNNMMMTIVEGLKQHNGFFPFYDSDTGLPAGQRNAVSGLIPLRLFLQIAGIRLITPDKVAVWGRSPLPWPINISWQGLSIHREGSTTEIIFPDGKTYQSESEQPVLLTSNNSGYE